MSAQLLGVGIVIKPFNNYVMKYLLKLTLFVPLLTVLFVNVITSKNDKSNHFSLENLVA